MPGGCPCPCSSCCRPRRGGSAIVQARLPAASQSTCASSLHPSSAPATRRPPLPCPCSYLHPSDQGHKALAEALAGPLMRAVGEAAAEQAAAAVVGQPAAPDDPERPPPGDAPQGNPEAGTVGSGGSSWGGAGTSIFGRQRQDPRLEGLPPPMVPGNEEVTTVSCFIQARTCSCSFGSNACWGVCCHA